MVECIYGCDGMDQGIPNKAVPLGSSLSDTPFMSVKRQQHLSWFMKNYQSPLEDTLFFTVFPLYCMPTLHAFMYYVTVAADVLSPSIAQACDSVIHIHVTCSEFR